MEIDHLIEGINRDLASIDRILERFDPGFFYRRDHEFEMSESVLACTKRIRDQLGQIKDLSEKTEELLDRPVA